MKQISWISEKEAAQMMGLKTVKYFRRLVKKGTFNISYRTRPSGKGFEYDAKAIEQTKNQNAVIL
jgi:DNA-dependent RNA polymerase auxiliary subunit epsilon